MAAKIAAKIAARIASVNGPSSITSLLRSFFQSESGDLDSRRIKKLAKELLALERAYALLQAQVGSAVDAEREELVSTLQ